MLQMQKQHIIWTTYKQHSITKSIEWKYNKIIKIVMQISNIINISAFVLQNAGFNKLIELLKLYSRR